MNEKQKESFFNRISDELDKTKIKKIDDELKLLLFIKDTGGKFPYSWAKDFQIFNMEEVNKRIEELKKIK